MATIRVEFSVDVPSDRWSREELKTMIAVAVTKAVPEEVPGAKVRWASFGGSFPEVVRTAELNGRSVRYQMERDAYDHWS